MFSPALAHVLARLLTREGWDGLYLNPRLRDGWRSWIVAWLGCVLLILAGAAVFFAAFPETFDPSLNTFREQLPEAARRAGEPLPLDPGVLFAIQAASAVLVAPIGPGTARLHRRGGPPAWAAAGRSSRVSRLLGGGAVDSPAVGRQRGARLRLGVHRSGAWLASYVALTGACRGRICCHPPRRPHSPSPSRMRVGLTLSICSNSRLRVPEFESSECSRVSRRSGALIAAKSSKSLSPLGHTSVRTHICSSCGYVAEQRHERREEHPPGWGTAFGA